LEDELEPPGASAHFARMAAPTPPLARKIPARIEQLGRVRTDDYAWLKDENWQQVLRDPKALRADVREHLDAENAYTKAMLASTEALQAQLFAEMKGRIKDDDASVPAPDGPWEYYSRYNIGAEHPLHARRPRGATNDEQVLLDEDALAKGKAYYQVGAAHHSPDHRLYAWAADEQGSEYFAIYIKDLATGELIGEPIASAYGDFTFSPDSAWLYWIWRDENARRSAARTC
jgi:oligopeptidase B